MADKDCPRCEGTGEHGGKPCEECQILGRGPRKISITFERHSDWGSPRPHDDVVDAFTFRTAHLPRERARELQGQGEPEEWLFSVFCLVDNPAGSGQFWPNDKRIGPSDFLPIEVSMVGPSEIEVRKMLAIELKTAGHWRWKVIKVQRKDQETHIARDIAAEALRQARTSANGA